MRSWACDEAARSDSCKVLLSNQRGLVRQLPNVINTLSHGLFYISKEELKLLLMGILSQLFQWILNWWNCHFTWSRDHTIVISHTQMLHYSVTVTFTAPQRISSVIMYKKLFGFRVNDCKWMILHYNGMVCNSTGVINVVYCNLHIPSVNVCDFALHWIAYHWTEYHCMTLQWYRSMCAILHTIGLLALDCIPLVSGQCVRLAYSGSSELSLRQRAAFRGQVVEAPDMSFNLFSLKPETVGVVKSMHQLVISTLAFRRKTKYDAEMWKCGNVSFILFSFPANTAQGLTPFSFEGVTIILPLSVKSFIQLQRASWSIMP